MSAASWLRRLRALWRNLVHGSARDADLRADIDAYVDLLTEEKIAAGLPPQAARRAALREFGSVAAVTETTRAIARDVRYALRLLRRDAGFSLVAILTLALGIGANTAVFSVVNAVLLDPLPYPDADRLVVVWERNPAIGKERDPVAPLNYRDWKASSTTLSDLGAYRFEGFALTGVDDPEQLRALTMTASMFSVLRTAPALGRVLTEDDERQQARVAVLAHAFWQRRFGEDPGVIGRSIVLDDAPFTVVGVMPAGFRFPDGDAVDLYTPLVLQPEEVNGRRLHSLTVMGRLGEGVSRGRAHAELTAIAAGIAAADRTSNPEVAVVGAHDALVEDVRLALVVLFGMVAVVLLIACANVANLLIVRAGSRQREIAMRAALGAGKGRLFAQLLTESVVLALAGSGAGLALAWWLLGGLAGSGALGVPRLEEIAIDLRVLLFVTAAALVTGILFGCIPAVHAATPRLADATRPEARGGSSASTRGRSLLLVAEIALALTLVASAALMARTFLAVRDLDLGFDPRGVHTAQVLLAHRRYPVDARQYQAVEPEDAPVAEGKPAQFVASVIERIAATPGIDSAAAVSALPLNPVGTDFDLPVIVAGRPRPRPGEEPQADFRLATADYFKTMGIPLLRGRTFTAHDGPNSPSVVVINDTLAREMFAGEDAVGQHILLYGRSREIIGVVGSVRHHGFSRRARPEMILPYRQFQFGTMTFVVKTRMDRAATEAAIVGAVRAVDPQQPVYRVQPMSELLADSIAQPRLTALLLGSFAGLALVLALVGVYGVTSYSVGQRAREIAVRVALGARRREVIGMVFGQSARYAAAGVIIGLAGAAAAGKAMEGLLFNVGAVDPATLVAAAAAVILFALAATYLPARRAALVDPIAVLRSE